MTPSEQAKQYAAEHGYTLTRVENLIVIKRDGHDIGAVSKYDRALRMMQSDQAESALFPDATFKQVADSESSAIRPERVRRIAADMRPRWRVWHKHPMRELSGWNDFHNYADAVRAVRMIYSDNLFRRAALDAGIKYSITRAP